jgi:hypothetical protein
MTYYIKKPIPIKAFDLQKTKVDDTGKDLIDGIETKEGADKGKMYINTLEGKHYARNDDYVIIGVEGERYFVKRNIFEKTYEVFQESLKK